MANLTYPKNAVELKIFATQMVIDKSTSLSSSRMAEIDKVIEHIYQSMGGDDYSNIDKQLSENLAATNEFLSKTLPVIEHFLLSVSETMSKGDLDIEQLKQLMDNSITERYREQEAREEDANIEVSEIPAPKTKKK